MALGAGGEIRQKLYPDPHGREAWDPEDRGRAEILLLDSRRFAELAGTPPPPTPVDAAAYAAAGLPWFDLYDESAAALAPAGGPPPWTVRDRDRERGEAAAEERPPGVDPDRVVTLRRRGPAPARRAVREGTDGPEGDGV